MDFTSYIDTELFIIIPVLYVVGMVIKKSTVNDKWIPIILGALGIALATAYKLAADFPTDASQALEVFYSGVTQGILCAAGSVYANNIVKQMKASNKNEDVSKDNSKDDSDLR